jgi:transcriptional regulator with XRE-family HTH domain
LEETLRNNILRELEKRDWKTTDLARSSNIPVTTLYAALRDEGPVWPQAETIMKVANGLGVTVASLVAKGPLVTNKQALEMVKKSIETVMKLSPEVLAELAKLDDDEMAKISEYILLVLRKTAEPPLKPNWP